MHWHFWPRAPDDRHPLWNYPRTYLHHPAGLRCSSLPPADTHKGTHILSAPFDGSLSTSGQSVNVQKQYSELNSIEMLSIYFIGPASSKYYSGLTILQGQKALIILHVSLTIPKKALVPLMAVTWYREQCSPCTKLVNTSAREVLNCKTSWKLPLWKLPLKLLE